MDPNPNMIDVAAISNSLGLYLRQNRSSVVRESRIHDAIVTGLGELGIECQREYRLTPQSRLDLWLPESGFIVEVKKGNAAMPALRQIGRYLEHPTVKGCLLIAMRCAQCIPKEFHAKPILKLELWKILL